MENKPNNEISELLARLQQKVEKKPEPKVDSVEPKGEESTEAILSLLKANIGVSEKEQAPVGNEEYDIKGYEWENNEPEDEEATREDKSFENEQLKEDEGYSKEEEARLHNRVAELINDAVEATGFLNFSTSTEEAESPTKLVVEYEVELSDTELPCDEPAYDEDTCSPEADPVEKTEDLTIEPVDSDLRSEEKSPSLDRVVLDEEISNIPVEKTFPVACDDIIEETVSETELFESAEWQDAGNTDETTSAFLL